jgi:predicted membrane-bound spermidine synthase
MGKETVKKGPAPMRLRVAAFAGGAVVMGLEISGSRILAPHFGSSVFVWGGLITVFLAALAGGYFVGGIFSDRHPHLSVLGYLLGLAGLGVLLVPLLAEPVCLGLRTAGPRWGPLLSALLLFAFPAFLLGTVSPYCMRLFAKDVLSVGRSAGALYTISTVGSLVGTFGATFVLIYLFSTPGVMVFFGLVLLGTGAVVLARRDAGFVVYLLASVTLAVVLLSTPRPPVQLSEIPGEVVDVLAEVETPYHRIFVTQGWNYYRPGGEPARYLQFDHYRESGVETTPPYDAATKYTDLFHLLFLFHERPRKVLFIGGGGMIGPRKFKAHYPFLERIDIVEIDPGVVEIAKKYFYFIDEPPIHVHTMDGRVFLLKSNERYDAVFLDIFTSAGAIPFHLTSVEFFGFVADHLAPDGVCIMNIISSLEGEKSRVFHGIRGVFERTFGQTYVFPRLYHRIQSLDAADRLVSRNIFLAGTVARDRLGVEEAARRGRELTRSGHVHPKFDLDMHAGNLLKPGDPPPRADVPLLTDEFNPLELWKFW